MHPPASDTVAVRKIRFYSTIEAGEALKFLIVGPYAFPTFQVEKKAPDHIQVEFRDYLTVQQYDLLDRWLMQMRYNVQAEA